MVMKINYVFVFCKVKILGQCKELELSNFFSFPLKGASLCKAQDSYRLESILYLKFFVQVSGSWSPLMLRDGMFSKMAPLVFRDTFFNPVRYVCREDLLRTKPSIIGTSFLI